MISYETFIATKSWAFLESLSNGFLFGSKPHDELTYEVQTLRPREDRPGNRLEYLYRIGQKATYDLLLSEMGRYAEKHVAEYDAKYGGVPDQNMELLTRNFWTNWLPGSTVAGFWRRLQATGCSPKG